MELYRDWLRPLIFATDPEWVHGQSLNWLERLGPFEKLVASQCCHQDLRLAQRLWGLDFGNPVGLAAGLDKAGQGIGMWGALGFGWAEVGTVTRHPQPGNPAPRLFRLPEDRAIINRMGFNNPGAVALAQRLQQIKSAVPLGINLGKSKITELALSAADYQFSFECLYPFGDYFVVNVSSPNTPGLRELQQARYLREIFAHLQGVNPAQKPLLVKIAPDLSEDDLSDIVELVLEFKLAGIIATNTTVTRPDLYSHHRQESGGLSGEPLKAPATAVLNTLWRLSEGRIPLVGVGGISTAEDAWERIIHGASLLQLYTGWVYEGPLVVKRILQGLSERCNQYQLGSLTEAIGLAHR
ncbi:quinone-dependent dihydroorotate dehydrogenase [Candidatus Cyanaurora vandensis]|uniref:quinone-dependent dihydroorotate dehydrogenase n=1 Tax=Candidatus Cyanaurora vandensis TaxID=2714958 RepID=UPI00257C0D9F|nr:quinone-dependent dihydroorotate dehydrogenase [Candidatus Cyanaurora vandensis]